VKLFLDSLEIGLASVYAVTRSLVPEGPRRIVVFYHSVKDHQRGQFDRQMVYLAEQCAVVKPSRIRNATIQNRKTLVAITFDDGFVSVLNNAVPILRKYGFTAAVCVPTGNLGKAPQWNLAENCYDADERVMDQQQLCQLDQEGFELLSHGVRHVPLAGIPDSELWSELSHSKEQLEQILGHQVVGISYPHGSWDERVIARAALAGYKCGFTIEPFPADASRDDLTIGRTSVSPMESLFAFGLKAKGAYQVVGYTRLCKRRILGLLR